MSFRNRTITLASVLGALVLVFVLTQVFSPENMSKRGAQGNLMLDFELAKIGKIEVGGKASYSLQNDNGAWTVKDATGTYPARKERIGFLVDALEGIGTMERVASSKSAWGNYGIGGSESYHVRVSLASGMAAAEFDTGLYDPTAKNVYVRPTEGDAVFAVNADFASYLKSAVADWQDKLLFNPPVASASIAEISMSADIAFDADGKDRVKDSWKLVLDQRTGAWGAEPAAALPLDPQKVGDLVGSLVKLEALSYVSVGQPAIDKPAATVAFKTLDGKSFTIKVGARDKDGNYALGLEGGAYTYSFSSWGLKSVVKSIAELVKVK